MSVNVDLLVSARRIYSVDEGFSFAECMAIRDGHIVAIGRRNDIEASYQARQKRDFGQPSSIGFITPHCHFLSFGYAPARRPLRLKILEEGRGAPLRPFARRDTIGCKGAAGTKMNGARANFRRKIFSIGPSRAILFLRSAWMAMPPWPTRRPSPLPASTKAP